MDYDNVALSEIRLLGDVLVAAATARARIPDGELDRVLQVPCGGGQRRQSVRPRAGERG